METIFKITYFLYAFVIDATSRGKIVIQNICHRNGCNSPAPLISSYDEILNLNIWYISEILMVIPVV
jgi:hypothetical protein